MHALILSYTFKYILIFMVRAELWYRGASRMRAGQGICVLKQSILSHFRPLLGISRANGLFKDTFLFEGRGCIPLPPRYAPDPTGRVGSLLHFVKLRGDIQIALLVTWPECFKDIPLNLSRCFRGVSRRQSFIRQ